MPANAKFLSDVTIPDHSAILAGTSFTKSWQVQNTGDVAWTPGFRLVFHDGVNLAAVSSMPVPPCAPGAEGQISIAMTAPTQAGTYTSNWVFHDDQGAVFGDNLYVIVDVQAVTNPVGQNDNYFVADVTFPDDSEVQPGTSFLKTWRVRNTGTLAWNDRYSLNLLDGTLPPAQASLVVPAVAPGGELNLSVSFTAPPQPGKYTSDWKMKDDNGQWFGVKLWTSIVVPGQAVGGGQADAAIAVQAPAPHYCQRDSRWANIPLANLASAPSIGRWGCMMTCFAMLASAMGHAVDPQQLNQLMVQNGGYTGGYLTRWDALQVVFGDIHFDGKLGQGQDTVNQIDASLQAGRPVPVQVDLTPATSYSDSDQHWVLVVGRNGADYWVNDPMDFDAKPASLLAKYGRPGGSLADSILSAILYHK